jgi:tetratricopeptide (TPR) repeat protein
VDDEFGEQAAERGDHEAARYHLQRAALAWRRRRDAPRSAASFSALGQALEALGHFAEATRAYTGAAARAEAAGDLVVAAYAYLRLASCAAHGHQRDFDVVQLRQVLEVAREAGDLRATIEALELLAVAEIQAGRTPAAAPLLEEAIGLAATHRLPLLLNRLLTVELRRLQLEAKGAEAAALQARVEQLPVLPPPEVPEPPVRLAARHVRPVLLRLFAFPVCGALWARGCLLRALVQGGPVVSWLGQLLLAAAAAVDARQRWLPGRSPLTGEARALRTGDPPGGRR